MFFREKIGRKTSPPASQLVDGNRTPKGVRQRILVSLAGFTITARSATNHTYTCSYGYSAGGTIYPNGTFPAVTDTSTVNDAWMKIWSIEMDYLIAQ